jgi:predicted ATP-grasp superfamily ATP-dependent carboligase
MARFSPEAHWKDEHGETRVKVFNTFVELKRELKILIKNSCDGEVTVYRSRRGEWGEWFEYWGLNYKRIPYVKKSGWM